MPILYNFFLNRKWSGGLFPFVFRTGLKLRSTLFFFRNQLGKATYSANPLPGTLSEKDVKKILILRTDRIGDIVLSTPALSAIRTQFPHAKIDYLVQTQYASLLNCYPGWDEILTIGNVDKNKELKKVGAKLKKRNYDIVFVQHPSSYAFKLAKLSEANYLIGWKAKGFGYLLSFGLEDDRAESNRHQVENNLRLLAPFSNKIEPPPFLTTETDKGKKELENFCAQENIKAGDRIFTIHPGSFSPRVRWVPAGFAAIANKALDNGFKVVLLGLSKETLGINQFIIDSLGKPIIREHLNMFSLEGLISFLKRTDIFLGNSTGTTHISASVGTWTIAVFGNRYPLDRSELWRPWGRTGMVVSSDKTKCCALPWTCPDMPCIRSISAMDVWKEVEKILKRSSS